MAADKYDKALALAEIDPSKLNRDQKELMKTLLSEGGSRGNRARAVMEVDD